MMKAKVARLNALMSGMAPAQDTSAPVGDCAGFAANTPALARPWEQKTRLFTNSAIRMTVTNMIEPTTAACPPPLTRLCCDEPGNHRYDLISLVEGTDFTPIARGKAGATHKPETSLPHTAPMQIFAGEGYALTGLNVVASQASGGVTARPRREVN